VIVSSGSIVLILLLMLLENQLPRLPGSALKVSGVLGGFLLFIELLPT
jgi:hypothetical protein